MELASLWAILFVSTLQAPDGTVVVLENSNRVVKSYTQSEVTHVAILLNVERQPWVYEATPGEVRRVMWSRYVAELGAFNQGRREKSRLRLRLYQPMRPYSPDEVADLKNFLSSQLGRRYSVKGFVRNQEGDGVHCAQLVSTALTRTGRYEFDNTYCLSPGSLVTALRPSHARPVDVALASVEPGGSWCERSCNWWQGLFAWCGWAWWEVWSYCR